MYRSILVPLDGSALSEHALPLACSIGQRSGATVRLVHVHRPCTPTPIYVDGMPVIDEQLSSHRREHERVYLERISERLAAGAAISITCATLDEEESVADSLVHDAVACGADLIVMTTHGWGGLARFWLGSVADALVRTSPVPVLLLRPSAEPPDLDQPLVIAHMLIPLDGSALAEHILEPALALGRVLQVSYTLIQVVEPVVRHTADLFIVPADHDVEAT